MAERTTFFYNLEAPTDGPTFVISLYKSLERHQLASVLKEFNINRRGRRGSNSGKTSKKKKVVGNSRCQELRIVLSRDLALKVLGREMELVPLGRVRSQLLGLLGRSGDGFERGQLINEPPAERV